MRRERRGTGVAEARLYLLSARSGAQLPVPPAVSLCHTSLVVYRQRIVGRLLNPDPASVSSGGDYVSMR